MSLSDAVGCWKLEEEEFLEILLYFNELSGHEGIRGLNPSDIVATFGVELREFALPGCEPELMPDVLQSPSEPPFSLSPGQKSCATDSLYSSEFSNEAISATPACGTWRSWRLALAQHKLLTKNKSHCLASAPSLCSYTKIAAN